MADTLEELVAMRRATDEAHARVVELRERFGPPATEPWSEAQTTTYETAWRAWRDLERDLQEAITQYAKNEGLDRNAIEQDLGKT
ncbi:MULTISPECIES: hypothetical protein [unclassified Streptomyces]|uniref:hypothetical protein n=1 Tax=unclassified Streptomyces TaxID=2593676 RepID=UPI0029A2C7BD|nr:MULTISPECIES: hypothetical protein [unclassified Streptomyces]MDX3772478.1 hypothetical protein [Streptomyces sp. AK08-01B]MDX3821984.1 hypothetical protein [Streptomyces sp. AK08-01A]